MKNQKTHSKTNLLM